MGKQALSPVPIPLIPGIGLSSCRSVWPLPGLVLTRSTRLGDRGPGEALLSVPSGTPWSLQPVLTPTSQLVP